MPWLAEWNSLGVWPGLYRLRTESVPRRRPQRPSAVWSRVVACFTAQQHRPGQSQRLGASDSELCGRLPERRRAGAISEARKDAARNRRRTATCRGVPRFRAPQLDTGLGRSLPRSGAASRWRGARCARRDVAPPAQRETLRRRKGRVEGRRRDSGENVSRNSSHSKAGM